MPKTDDLALPRVKHFTVDGSKEVEDFDDLAPSMAMDPEDAERVHALREAAREQYEKEAKEREKSEDARRQAWADGDLPKPSELLAEREGRAEGKKKSKSNGEKSKSS